MKKFLVGLACAVLLAGLSFGAPLTCQSLGGTDVDVGGGNPLGVSNSITCTNGPLTFSNFFYANNVNDPSPVLSLTNPQPNQQGDGTDRVGADYFLGLNPNLPGLLTQDLHAIYMVTGSVIQVSLADPTGQLSGIGETICTADASQSGAALSNFLSGLGCSALSNGSQLATLSVNDGGNVSENITPASVLWVYKDINAQAGGHLSGFNEDFLVPEPTTLLLIGVGLAALGLVNRRKKA